MRVAFIATDNREHYKDYDAPTPRFNAGVEALMLGFSALPDMEVHIISCSQKPMRAQEQFAPKIVYHCLHVPKIGWLRTMYQGCIRSIWRELKKIQPDVVHGYGTERECAISATLSGFPNVTSIQGNMVELAKLFRPRIGSYGWLTARLENFTLRRTGGVVCNSNYTKKLVEGRCPRAWVVHPALRPEFLEPVPATSRPCILLNAGVITGRKRQLELLGVAEELHRQGLKFEFRFIGRTEKTDYCRAFQERIKPMEEAGYARYLGLLPNSELVRCYDSVSGMIHYSNEEAFGMNVAEALARNLKFFGSRLGGILDIASGVPGAELFEKDDWAGLTAAIAAWIRQGWPRPDGSNAIMRERFHPQVVARRHVEIYHEVLNIGRREPEA
jgi:glycosyltransferase involved in cell wall biosynthesis